MNEPNVNIQREIRGILCRLFVMVLIFMSGCSIPSQQFTDELRNAVDSFDRAIDALAQQSADWQVVLQTLEEELVEDIQSTARTEVTNLLRSGILTTGLEFRCNAEFLRLRMEQELIRIRNAFVMELNQAGLEIPLLPETPPEPFICSVVPVAVDLSLAEERRSTLEVYGFSFQSAPINVEIVSFTGQRHDVTSSLGIISEFQMVLDLSRTGASLDDQSRYIVFSWNNESQSVVPILNPVPQIECTTRIERVTPNQHYFIPTHKEGDTNFYGHGPCVKFWLILHMDAERRKIRAQITMDAYECSDDWRWCSDYTRAFNSKSVLLYTVPNPDERIISFNLKSGFYHEYRDVNKDGDAANNFEDVFDDFNERDPVEKLIYIGDTDASEAGTVTSVKIYFRELEITLEKCEVR